MMPPRVRTNDGPVRQRKRLPFSSAASRPSTKTSKSAKDAALITTGLPPLTSSRSSRTRSGPPSRRSARPTLTTSWVLMRPPVFSSTHALRSEER